MSIRGNDISRFLGKTPESMASVDPEIPDLDPQQMIKVRYRKQTGDQFQEETFWDGDYENAQRRFGEAIRNWAQVEIVLFDHEDDRLDLVILDRQGLD